MSLDNRAIIVNPVRDMYYGLISHEQKNLAIKCIVIAFVFLDISSRQRYPLNLVLPVLVLLGTAYAYYYLARTHEVLQRNKALYHFHKRRLKGNTYFLKLKATLNQMHLLLPDFKVLDGGLIDFGNNTWGYIILCNPKKPGDNELEQRVLHLKNFINSFSHKIVLKVTVNSQSSPINPVEDLCVRTLNKTNSAQERAILYSMHDMSHDAKKPVRQYFNILLGIEEIPKEEIRAYTDTLMPGVMAILQTADVEANLLTEKRDIMSVYVNEFTSTRITLDNRPTALLKDGSIFTNMIRQLIYSSIREKEDHLVVNRDEYVSCLVAGMPSGGVSGYSDVSPSLISQIYKLNLGDEYRIRTTLTLVPIDPSASIHDLRERIDKTETNIENAIGSESIRTHYGLDKEDLGTLYTMIKRGEDRLNYVSLIFSVIASSYPKLMAGLSKVKAVLSANTTLSYIPEGEILETIRTTRPIPIIDYNQAVQMPSEIVARITPLITNSSSRTSKDGIWWGNNGDEEVVTNPEDQAAGHCVVLGPTGSGKSGAVLTRLHREIIFQGRDVVYITIKEDKNTSYRSTALWHKENAQIIDIGPKINKNEAFYNINPLEILYNSSTEFIPKNVFNKHISILKNFISVLCGDSYTNSPNMQTYFETSLRELYDSFGIKPDNPDTWHPATQPTLKDLIKIWERDKEGGESTLAKTANALYAKLSSINSGWEFLSEQTNVKFDKKLTVVDLSGVDNIDSVLAEALNYFLTAILALRFNIEAKRKTTIIIDEARVFLKNKMLREEIVKYLSKGRSFGVRLVLATQHVSDLKMVDDEFKQNTFTWQIMVNNIMNNIDILKNYLHLSPDDIEYCKSASRPGQCLLIMGAPYKQTYRLFIKLSPLEEEIIFGKKRTTDSAFKFVKPAFDQLSKEQKVIWIDWISGDTSELRQKWVQKFEQCALGQGKKLVYIHPDIIDANGQIDNEGYEHYINLAYLAGWAADHDIPYSVNHHGDSDLILQFPSGTLPIEYQSEGHNRPEIILSKLRRAESTHGRLLFTGTAQACKEIRRALKTDETTQDKTDICHVINRGDQLEKFLTDLLCEGTENSEKKVVQNEPILSPFLPHSAN